MATETHTIDASGQSLGRVASAAAKALMGKNSAAYTPNVNSMTKVTIVNAGKLFVREAKKINKTYTRYSGYPGGLRKESLQQLTARKGNSGALILAIQRMLPRNTMRTSRMKNLTVTE